MKKHAGWHFPVEVDPATGRVKTVENDDAVRQSIKIILKTDPGERLMRPSFGAGLSEFMFGHVDLPLMVAMTDTVQTALKRWEPHLKDLDVNVTDSDGTKIYVKAEYKTDFSPEPQELAIENDLF